jgi:hypothetical protein
MMIPEGKPWHEEGTAMRKITLTLLAFVGALFVTITSHTPAQAQPVHTWVASNGNDGANCDRPTPCATFQGAYGKTNAGGEITCVDGGNYGFLNISKPLTINCEAVIGTTTSNGGASIGGIGVSGLAATDVVILRGLDIDGANVSAIGALVLFISAGTLRLEKMRVSNIHGASHGISFQPSGAAKLHVSDSFIANNGISGSGINAGINIKPGSSVEATVMIERTVIDNNLFGIFLDGTNGGTIRGVVKDSVVSGNLNNGISINTSGANVSLLVDNATVSGNNYGLAVAGTGGLLLVRRSTITANNNGVATFNGGQAVSYRDNAVNNNTVDGAFSFSIGTQ